MSERIVCWFSHGAASTVAAKLAIVKNRRSPEPKELVVVSIFIEDEHEDNERYRADCEAWLGQDILMITSEKYNSSVSEVVKQTKYMSGVNGARCTKELKKQVRLDWQEPNDIHVFGMTSEEESRIDALIDNEPCTKFDAPLITAGCTKQDCFKILEDADIRLPEMYHLGFPNNNCKGCLKSSSVGYWNLVRNCFPDVFEKRAREEELLGVALCNMSTMKLMNAHPEVIIRIAEDIKSGKLKQIKIKPQDGQMRIPLRYLPEGVGIKDPIYVPDCGFFCEPN
jgi:hypothetical protein